MARLMSDVDVAIRILPRLKDWPTASQTRTSTSDTLRDGGEALRNLFHGLDAACVAIENDSDLSPQGIAKKREEIGRKALQELERFAPLHEAEKAVAANIEQLERTMKNLPAPPTEAADIQIAAEIRALIRAQGDSLKAFEFIQKHASDPRVLGAVVDMPVMLTNLTQTQHDVIKAKVRQSLYPQQIAAQEQLTKTLAELREGVGATKRAIVERAKLPASVLKPPKLDMPEAKAKTETKIETKPAPKGESQPTIAAVARGERVGVDAS